MMARTRTTSTARTAAAEAKARRAAELDAWREERAKADAWYLERAGWTLSRTSLLGRWWEQGGKVRIEADALKLQAEQDGCL